MRQLRKASLKEYLPLFLLLCFSGNPEITSEFYSKPLLVIYAVIFLIYTRVIIGIKMPETIWIRLTGVLSFILILIICQYLILDFVSYPGVLAIVLKLFLVIYTFLYYQYKKLNFFHIYIKILTFLVIVSIPFFLLNYIGFYGVETGSTFRRTFFLYTSYSTLIYYSGIRNAGMFWEPGAFAGYLIIAVIFVALRNGKFIIGNYRNEIFWIVIGLITTMSTTGFIALGLIINIYIFQNYGWVKYVILPVTIIAIYWAYFQLDFMQEKIENQYESSREMQQKDISNSRFGALTMDLQYIQSQPLFGNGLDIKTRYRFHPWVKEDIGHGNGMSNFLANWGIPFFVFWLYCVYTLSFNVSKSRVTSWLILFLVILILQGEQFLNYPLFLLFFIIPGIKKQTLQKFNPFKKNTINIERNNSHSLG